MVAAGRGDRLDKLVEVVCGLDFPSYPLVRSQSCPYIVSSLKEMPQIDSSSSCLVRGLASAGGVDIAKE